MLLRMSSSSGAAATGVRASGGGALIDDTLAAAGMSSPKVTAGGKLTVGVGDEGRMAAVPRTKPWKPALVSFISKSEAKCLSLRISLSSNTNPSATRFISGSMCISAFCVAIRIAAARSPWLGERC